MAILDSFKLQGRIALVTGASRGIGHAIAQGLAEAGATVHGLSRSPRVETPCSFEYHACDILDHQAVSKLINAIAHRYNRLDILVNAAGITLTTTTESEALAAFHKTLAMNLTAAFDCCRMVIPHMILNGYGSIINVTSINAMLGFPGNPGYVASKGALAAVTRALALDHGMDGVRVNNLVPGYVHTAMTHASYEDPLRQAARAARTMLGRWGTAQELAGAAVFLASPASSYVTGADLVVDGGWSSKGL